MRQLTYLPRVSCWIVFSIFWFAASAQTTYYVSASGNDSALGTSAATAWKTLAKVNSKVFNSGDIVKFNRGDVFTGKLVIKYSITVDAYGTGNNPVISGAEQLGATWTVLSGNVYQYTFSTNKPSAINNLFEASTRLPIARQPNKGFNNGYFNYESHSGTSQITDNQLTTTYAAGDELVLRYERFAMARMPILSQSGTTINFTPSSGVNTLRDGYGYFFVNSINAIDTLNEWAYKASTGNLYLYSATSPNSRTLYFPRTDTTIYVSSAANVVIQNIDVKYANKYAICLKSSSNSVIQNVNISNIGGDGVNYNACSTATFQNNTIRWVNGTGILTNGTSSAININNNTIADIGDEAYGKAKTFIGIDCDSPNSFVVSNTVSRTGYSGIICAGLNNKVQKNLVDSADLSLEDMGGIYTNYNVGHNNGMIIEDNIVLRSVGERNGAPAPYSKANGIYIDNLSTSVTVRNNTVAFVNGSGIFANADLNGNQIYGNTSYGSGVSELHIYTPKAAPGFLISNNILVTNTTDTTHNVFYSQNTDQYSYTQMGAFTSNYIINPFYSKTISFSFKDGYTPVTKRYAVYEWEAAAPEINGTSPAQLSYGTGVNPDTLQLIIYNTTGVSKVSTLPSGINYVDAKNNAYCGTVTVAPYRSVVLFKQSAGGCATVGSCGPPGVATIDSVTDHTARLTWLAVSGSINYDVRYRPEADTTWKYANNIHATSVTLQGLLPETYYQSQVRASCYGSESAWVADTVFRTGIATPAMVFINADTVTCTPLTAIVSTSVNNDNKWGFVNSGGVGTLDRDLMQSFSATENSPPITLNAPGVLDECSTYDVYLYYQSPASQPWKTKAKLPAQANYTLFDRTTPGAVLLQDINGNSDRLYKAKIGSFTGSTTLTVMMDDTAYNTTSARSVIDGVGFIKTSDQKPLSPSQLSVTDTTDTAGISIAWTDNATDETAYVVERRQDANPFITVAVLAANATTYTDTTSVAGRYTYRVYAKKNNCNSSYSNQATGDNASTMLLMRTAKSSGAKIAATDSATVLREIKQSGGDKPEEQPLVYPSPSNGNFTLVLPQSAVARKVRIRNIYGKQVYAKTFFANETTAHISLTSPIMGVYILEVMNNTGTYRYKLLIQ